MQKVSADDCPCFSCAWLEIIKPEIKGFKIMNPNGKLEEIFHCGSMHRDLHVIDVDIPLKSNRKVPDVLECNLQLQKPIT